MYHTKLAERVVYGLGLCGILFAMLSNDYVQTEYLSLERLSFGIYQCS